MKSAIFLLVLLSTARCFAEADYDGDNINDNLYIKIQENVAKISIHSSRSDIKKFSYDITSECGNFTIYPGNISGSLVVDQSCNGRKAQINKELYNWDSTVKTWMLQKTVSGEAGDQIDGTIPRLEVKRMECCIKIESNSDAAKSKSSEASIKEINDDLNSIKTNFNDKEKLEQSLKNWSPEMSAELAGCITEKNIAAANDLAYYLWKNSRPTEAAIILEKVLQNNPSRTVAILNFADSLWDFESEGFRKKAREQYTKYKNQMIAANKEKIIPARVHERL